MRVRGDLAGKREKVILRRDQVLSVDGLFERVGSYCGLFVYAMIYCALIQRCEVALHLWIKTRISRCKSYSLRAFGFLQASWDQALTFEIGLRLLCLNIPLHT